MTNELQEIAEGLGAKIVGTIPDVGGGAFGAAHLARIYQKRMEERREPAQHPTERLLEVAIGEGNVRNLERLADWLSKPERHYSLEEVAARLLGFAIEYWLEQVTHLQSSEEAARTKYLEARKAREEAERALQTALREMSGTAGRQATD